ncbi:hypothetical protein C6P97_22240 [Burkholderia multivorans]|uniref:Uncharacterized protein n=1 Tax=Burkholderia multivorans TaxID=87883 RepID=A0AB37B0Z0_9BURK|nr:hypothetical protein C6P97_22240 [Burkholderia multivorans]PRE55628.1 hypothetical protein C6P99_01890 [Burkholderia multivorans]
MHQVLDLPCAPDGEQPNIAISAGYAAKRPQRVIEAVALEDVEQGDFSVMPKEDVAFSALILLGERLPLERANELVVAVVARARFAKRIERDGKARGGGIRVGCHRRIL